MNIIIKKLCKILNHISNYYCLQLNFDYEIYCNQNQLHLLNEKIINKFGPTSECILIWKSESNIEIEKESAEKLFKLMNTLEENEDVQSVSSNFDISEETMQTLSQ